MILVCCDNDRLNSMMWLIGIEPITPEKGNFYFRSKHNLTTEPSLYISCGTTPMNHPPVYSIECKTQEPNRKEKASKAKNS